MSADVSLEPAGDLAVDVHDAGRDLSLDGILRLIQLAGQERPLEQLLAAMCPLIASIAGADVTSVYVREVGPGGDLLVMRGNVGFPATVVGRVQLRMGEGITGLVAECMRPVSVASPEQAARFKYVPGIGEERYPAFLGVPLLSGGRVIGVLVIQRRRAEAFGVAEITLATALGAPVVAAIEGARRRAIEGATGRSARLTGIGRVPGTAMGRVAVIPTLASLAAADDGGDATTALDRLGVELDRARRKLKDALDPEVSRALDNLGLALIDHRLRERLTASGKGLVAALRGVAREYARVPYRVPVKDGAIDAALAERAREIEDLCVLLHGAATGARSLPPGAVYVGDRLGAFVALSAVARGAAAIVCDGPVADGPGLAVARAAQIPVLSDVDSLYAWARPGDLVVVDADRGVLRVNPAASSMESFRREQD